MCRLFKRENDNPGKTLGLPSGAALFFAASQNSAQHEVGAKLHTINYMGDLGGGGGMGTVFLEM